MPKRLLCNRPCKCTLSHAAECHIDIIHVVLLCWLPSTSVVVLSRVPILGWSLRPGTVGICGATLQDISLGSPRHVLKRRVANNGSVCGGSPTTRGCAAQRFHRKRTNARETSTMELEFGEEVSGSLRSGETELYHTQAASNDVDLEIRLIVHKGNADLYVNPEPLDHPPSSAFNRWKGDYGSGDEVVFISYEHNDFIAGKFGVSVVGRAVESEWTLRVDVFNETRSLNKEERDAIEEIHELCCESSSSCSEWKGFKGRGTEFCYMKGNFCTIEGNVDTFDIQQDALDCPFPIQFASLSKLRTLQLKSNQISGDASSIGEVVAGMSSLERLLIANNKVTGELPCSLFGQPMHNIDLSSNELRGRIPECFSTAASLEELNIASNRIEGSIPALPENLSALIASDNYLSGSFPDTFRSARKLSSVALARNRFNGVIAPGAFPTTVQEVRLANNALSGKLPNDLFLLPNLRIFSGAFNQFSGGLPASTFVGSNLVLLDLRGNQFDSLPEVYNSTNLEYLDVAMNCMTGSVPPTFKGLKELQTLNMQENAFSGSIDVFVSDTNLPRLRVLNISHNVFSGSMPAGVSKIIQPSNSTRFVLDVSNNYLNGLLPALFSGDELARSAARGFLTVNLRNNVFSCPLPDNVDWIQDLSCSSNSGVKVPTASEVLFNYRQCTPKTTEESSLSSGAVAGIVLALLFMCIVLLSLGYIAWQHHKARKQHYLMNLEEHIELHEQRSEASYRQ